MLRLGMLTSGGTPDPAFGNAGSAAVPGISALTSAFDAQDRMLIGGSLGSAALVTRLTAAGAVDSGFGDAGTASVAVNNGFISDVIALDDGGVVAMTAAATGQLYGLDPAGDADLTFAGDGVLTLAPVYLHLQRSGPDVVAAGIDGGFGAPSIDVYRVSPAGELVQDFGADGIADISVAPANASPASSCVDQLGRLVLVGAYIDDIGTNAFVARMWL